ERIRASYWPMESNMPLNSHEQIPLGRSSQCRFGPAAPGSGRADNQAEDVAAAASEEGGLGGKFTPRAIDSHGSPVSRRRRRKQREGDDQHGAPCGTSNRSPSPSLVQRLPRCPLHRVPRAETSRLLARADVHVGVEEVLWVVLLLELTQPRIVGPIGHRRRVARLVRIEIVYVAEGAEIRSERGVGLATPLNSPPGVVRIGPLR